MDLSLHQLRRDCAARVKVLDWPHASLIQHLGTVYGKRSIEELNYVEAARFRAHLDIEWQRGFDAAVQQTREQDADETVPFLFRSRGGAA